MSNLQSRQWSNVCVVWALSVLTQPTHLWRAWRTLGQPEVCQLKPIANLRGLVKPAIFSSSYSPCRSSFSLVFSLLFFSNQVRFYQASSVSNHYQLWNFRQHRACGNHCISCAHLAQHLYRRAGGFWKGEKSFTKGVSETTNCQWKYFHTLLNLFFLFLSFLFCWLCAPNAVRHNWLIAQWTYIKKYRLSESLF